MQRSNELRKARVNPARAGMIPFALATLYPNYCKPRASGDDPFCLNFEGEKGE